MDVARSLLPPLLLFAASLPVVSQSDTAPQAVTAPDFFLYSCVRHYQQGHDIPLLDGSVGYAVEHATTQ